MPRLGESIFEIVSTADYDASEAATDVILDTVITYLSEHNAAADGALTIAIELLSLESDVYRLRRQS